MIANALVAQPLQRVDVDLGSAQADLDRLVAVDDVLVEQAEQRLPVGNGMRAVSFDIRVRAEVQEAE